MREIYNQLNQIELRKRATYFLTRNNKLKTMDFQVSKSEFHERKYHIKTDKNILIFLTVFHKLLLNYNTSM